MPDAKNVDIMIGYCAYNSYFSFAEDFINNTISLRDLNHAMQLGSLIEQIMLLSNRSFEHIEFAGLKQLIIINTITDGLSKAKKPEQTIKAIKRVWSS